MPSTPPNEPAAPAEQQPAADPAPTEPPTWGPPPPAPDASPLDRRRGRLIAIAVVVSVAVVAAGVFGLTLLTGADDGSDTVDGAGYSYEIPDDWIVALPESYEDNLGGTLIDSMSGPADADGGIYRGVVIEVDDVDPDATARQEAETWRQNIGLALGSTAEPAEGTTISGERALGARVEYDREGVEMVVRGYLVLREGTVYTIGYRTEAAAEREGMATFNALLDSWTWTDDRTAADS